MLSSVKTSFAVAVIIVTASCAPTKAYYGEELPESDTASIHFRSVGGPSVRSMEVNGFGVGLLDWGIRAPAGDTSYALKMSYDASACMDAERFCISDMRHFKCTGSFPATAGQAYVIKVTIAGIWVIDEASEHVISTATCTKDSLFW